MPHATETHRSLDDHDDYLIGALLDPTNPTQQTPLNLDRELELGEKAEDAVDYEEISDNDLADDDGVDVEQAQHVQGRLSDQEVALSSGLEEFLAGEKQPDLPHESDFSRDEIDDLFGENAAPVQGTSRNLERNEADWGAQDSIFGGFHDGELTSARSDQQASAVPHERIDLRSGFTDRIHDPHINGSLPSKEQQLQQQLFAMSRFGQDILPAPPENQEEMLASLWPKFKRDSIPEFIDLLPPKRARYIGKVVPKPPKPIHPTKVSLELAQDHERIFKTWSSAKQSMSEESRHLSIVSVDGQISDERVGVESFGSDSDLEDDALGGISWQDLQIICGDWDTHSIAESHATEHSSFLGGKMNDPEPSMCSHVFDLQDFELPFAKRRKVDRLVKGSSDASQTLLSPKYDPVQVTKKLSETVILDLNDRHLLIDQANGDSLSHNVPGRLATKNIERGYLREGLNQRYNISNDEAYDLLKENHQSKVRSMLNNVAVEHSFPAVRLQWPFYKTKLDKHEARAFHRPALKLARHEQVSVGKPKFIKRKHLRNRDIHNLFHTTRDLSLGDNSNVLLLEYSEEYPTMMSNVGMGNRVLNYYRRKTVDDTARPKLDIGETVVLLPQDKSPFSLFGHVDAGQTVPALYNGMYRAPIFKQDAKGTDFLLIKTSTGIDGSAWYLRNIENIYAVGQELPSIDVPGPHSRKVTTASKNRLKMISYRLIRKNKTHRINVGEVTDHFIDTTDMQNRQKMKEFMQFNKEHKEWQMRSGEAVPDEDSVRSMVKPEDVCLLESMQVGQQHLHDAGFNKEDDESEGDDAKEGQSIEQQLAPWFTSRNFLHAAQGKAMLALHGEGDPTGRGEAFSFIKTSMKGGFKAAEASATEKIRAKQMKDSSGHAYNVQEQQKSYEQSIRRTWEAQKQSLSSVYEPTDLDMDEDPVEEASKNVLGAGTPRSETQTPRALRQRDDESTSQFTQHSTGSQLGRILRITRHTLDEAGVLKPISEFVRDPRVIRQYLKRRHQIEEETLGISDMVPTLDPEKNRRREIWLIKEHERLQKNKERRIARDKAKGIHVDGAADDAESPSSPTGVPAKSAGTGRKCASCGQIGHIKTNKKLCPMLNGTMQPEEGFSGSAFTMGAAAQ